MVPQILEGLPDLEKIVRVISSPTMDVEALRQAREEADRLRERMRAKYGVRDIAVALVNETRNRE